MFVGGLPRTCTAKELSDKVEKKFGNVLHCSIELEFDTSYPKGAARIVFGDLRSYCKAAVTGHIDENWFQDRHCSIEFKPFVYKDIPCELCQHPNRNTRFCPAPECLSYLCNQCYTVRHLAPQMANHQAVNSQPRDLPHPCRMELHQAQLAKDLETEAHKPQFNDVVIPNIQAEKFNVMYQQKFPISEAQYRSQTGFANDFNPQVQPPQQPARSTSIFQQILNTSRSSNRQFGQLLNQINNDNLDK